MTQHEHRPEGRVSWLPWACAFVAIAALVQLALPHFFDADTGYHVAVARLMRAHGVLHAFPWTTQSWLAGNYADKEFLFHVLLVPLASLDADTASRLAGAVLGAGLLLTLFALCRAEGVRLAGLWPLVVLVSSGAFVWRFAIVRPHLLSIPLALVVSWAATRRRWKTLFGASVLYPLCYTAWHLPLVLVGVVEAARWLSDRRPEWRPAAVVCAGLALGIVVHPNFPETLRFFWIQNVDVLLGTAWAGAPGFELGGEFRPFSLPGMGRYLLWPALLGVGAALLAWRERRDDVLPLAIACTACAFLLLTLRTQRFVEYLAPFAGLAAALAWRPPRSAALVPALLCLCAAWLATLGTPALERLMKRSVLFPPAVRAALERTVPEGAQVFTCDWHFTGEMMLALPERRFLVALDPVFFWKKDPDAYRLWYDTVHRPPERPAGRIRDAFGARWVLCDRRVKWLPFIRALEADPRARRRAIAGFWAVYELTDEVTGARSDAAGPGDG